LLLPYITIGYQKSHWIEGRKDKFLFLEPLIGPLGKLNLKKINWVIVGGESGPGARPILPENRRPIFLQAMGRRPKEESRENTRGQDVG
jgi:hypothetical protein